MQAIAQRIATALHDLETAVAALPPSVAKKRVEAKTRLLHGRLEHLAREHGPALGIDPVPLSGGGAKPPAQ